ncbi:O-antigen ligase family protein [Patulibacter sp. SYSU D01012]|uniref:O-antigen ligase family protein n=1 Tax=Patulibacter sp. SYSU D01012 TaxID=2817381 RepID=UPI001B314278|nr:O-antigen ligase family protein [Patulibacter sp. SYSU D01012]
MATAAPHGPWTPAALTPVVAGALLVPLAAALGALVAYDPALGVAGCVAVVFAAVVLLSLPVALGGLVALIFVSGLPGMIGVPAASTAVVGFAWFATLPARRAQLVALRGPGRLALWAPWILFAWMGATAAWAPDGGLAASRMWQVFAAVVAVPIIATGADRPRTVRIVVAAYVAGAAGIVLAAIVLGPSSYAHADPSNGRLEVANFSANLLGATAASALVLVPAVWRMTRRADLRLVVAGLGALLLYGLVGTQSRSGVVALAVAALAALVVCRGRRRAIAAGIAVAVAGLALFVALQPGLLERTQGGDSTGRTDIWKAAVAVWHDHPVGGVGVGNFTVVSPRYALRLGALDAPDFVTVDPMPPHNLVLEALAETGVVGLALVLLAVGACVAATLRAARLLGRHGDDELAFLAQLVLVAQVAIVTAGMFLPVTANRQLWTLLALGPALLGLALRGRSRTEALA